MHPVIYGIPNCDSVKKARQWFDAHAIAYTFVDVRKTPPSREQLARWMDCVGANLLINKRSTTWKNMSPNKRQEAEHGDTLTVLLDNPTLIKRPVLEHAGDVAVGFKADSYAQRFNH